MASPYRWTDYVRVMYVDYVLRLVIFSTTAVVGQGLGVSCLSIWQSILGNTHSHLGSAVILLLFLATPFADMAETARRAHTLLFTPPPADLGANDHRHQIFYLVYRRLSPHWIPKRRHLTYHSAQSWRLGMHNLFSACILGGLKLGTLYLCQTESPAEEAHLSDRSWVTYWLVLLTGLETPYPDNRGVTPR